MGVLIAEINQFRMEQMKDRLPIKMQPLTKNDAPGSEWLFDIDLNKKNYRVKQYDYWSY